jgi:hypothetical protein
MSPESEPIQDNKEESSVPDLEDPDNQVFAANETTAVRCLKLVVLALLIFSAISVGLATYFFTSNTEGKKGSREKALLWSVSGIFPDERLMKERVYRFFGRRRPEIVVAKTEKASHSLFIFPHQRKSSKRNS